MHHFFDHGIYGVVLSQVYHARFFVGTPQGSSQKRPQIVVLTQRFVFYILRNRE